MSHVFTTPSESLEIAIPSTVCRLMDLIGTEVDDAGFGLLATGSVDKGLICQNLADLSSDVEMSKEGEENAREVMASACPTKVSIRQGSELIMSQT